MKRSFFPPRLAFPFQAAGPFIVYPILWACPGRKDIFPVFPHPKDRKRKNPSAWASPPIVRLLRGIEKPFCANSAEKLAGCRPRLPGCSGCGIRQKGHFPVLWFLAGTVFAVLLILLAIEAHQDKLLNDIAMWENQESEKKYGIG